MNSTEHYPSWSEGIPQGSYHALIRRYVAKSRHYCADVTSVQYVPPFELKVFAYDARFYRQLYAGILLPDDAEAMETAIEIVANELERRDQLSIAVRSSGVAGYVYLLSSPFGFYKIGCSTKPKNRLMTFGVQLPFEVDCLCTIYTGDMYGLEHQLHERFAEKRSKGEWFELSESDVDYIKGLSV